MRTAAPGNSHGTLKSRHCAVCGMKRLTLMFRGPMTIRNGWVDHTIKVPVCDPCIRSAHGSDYVEMEIAAGRLSFKSQRPTPQTEQMSLSLEEEK